MYMYILEKHGQEKFQLSLSLFYKNKVFKRHVDKKVSEKTIKEKLDLLKVLSLHAERVYA